MAQPSLPDHPDQVFELFVDKGTHSAAIERAALVVTPDLLHELQEQSRRWCVEPELDLAESCEFKMVRSILSLSNTLDVGAIRRTLSDLLCELGTGSPPPLPTRTEMLDLILPAFANAREAAPFTQISLGVSTPTCDRSTCSLNVIARAYDLKARLNFRAKVGLFRDEHGMLFWELGFLHATKGLGHLERTLDLETEVPTTPSELRRVTSRVHDVAVLRGGAISGLDLTPASPHLMALAAWLGATTDPPGTPRMLRSYLNGAIRTALLGDPPSRSPIQARLWKLAREQLMRGRVRPVIAAMLIDEGLIMEPGSNRVIRWDPPRMIISLEAEH